MFVTKHVHLHRPICFTSTPTKSKSSSHFKKILAGFQLHRSPVSHTILNPEFFLFLYWMSTPDIKPIIPSPATRRCSREKIYIHTVLKCTCEKVFSLPDSNHYANFISGTLYSRTIYYKLLTLIESLHTQVKFWLFIEYRGTQKEMKNNFQEKKLNWWKHIRNCVSPP